MLREFSTFLEDKNIKGQLDLALKNKELSHSYLFVGSEGVGKFTQAKNFAQAILCASNDNPKSFCNLADEFSHPDLLVIKKKESIKKEDIEDLIEKAARLPFEAGKKVILINDFDRATSEAQNAFLKTLEEPPAYLIIILLATNKMKLLSTIRSRCRILRFSDLSQEKIYDYLIKSGVSENNADLFSRLSCGSINLANSYVNDSELLKKHYELIGVLDSLIRDRGYYIFSYLDYFRENKENIEEILRAMTIWFRDLAFIKLNKKDKVINIDKLKLLELENLALDRCLSIYGEILLTKERLGKNINFDLAVQALLMHIGGM